MFSKTFLTFTLIFSLLSSAAICMDEKQSSNITIPKVSTFFAGDYLSDKTDEDLGKLYKEGLKKQLISRDIQGAITDLTECARHGYPPAMLALGNNIENPFERLHYYILAFETHWEKTETHYQPALNAINELGTKAAKHFLLLKESGCYSEDDPFFLQLSEVRFYWVALAYIQTGSQLSLTDLDIDLKIQRFLKQIKNKDDIGGSLVSLIETLPKDVKQFQLNLITKLFELSNTPNAKFYLGTLYKDGKIGENAQGHPDYQKAEAFFISSGTPESLYNLSCMYIHGMLGKNISEQKRYKEIERLLKASGMDEARHLLGAMYYDGKLGQELSEEKRYQKAADLLMKSEKPEIKHNLGILYSEGKIGKNAQGQPDYQKAEEFFISSKLPESKCALGGMYVEGNLGADLPKEMRYIKAKDLLIASGTPEAKYNLGIMYYKGKIGKKNNGEPDYQQAAKLFEQSGTPEAKFNLGTMYNEGKIGKKNNGEPDYQQAAKLFEQSGTPIAKFNLGTMYADGLLGQKLPTQQRYIKAKDFFIASGTPEAKFNLAILYRDGKIGKNTQGQPDYQKAEEFFTASKTLESKQALGEMYYFGNLGTDLPKEIRYTKAQTFLMESGIPSALYTLGVMYEDGSIGAKDNGEPDYQQAAKLFEQSAISEADFNLGVLYSHSKLGSELNDLERYQKMSDLFSSAFLKGSMQAKHIISWLGELIESQKQRLEDERATHLPTSVIATSSNYVDGFQETSEKEHRSVPYIKSKEPKISREERIKQLKEELSKVKMEKVRVSDGKQVTHNFEVIFISKTVEEEFKELMQQHNVAHKKLQEVMEDLLKKPWSLEGSGQPERLKHSGYWSRRLNHEDRLVYTVEAGKITIISCKGHYVDLPGKKN